MQIDREAALALTKELADADARDRHHGNIAHELAGRDPAQAERVLAMVKDRSERDDYTVRVVYRMAPLDLARARRLASSIDDNRLKRVCPGNHGPPPQRGRRGQGLGAALLENAYELLERSSRASQANVSNRYDPTSIAGVLLPVAERIDPGLVDEYLWRSLAMRQPLPWETDTSGQSAQARSAQADVLLAMMLARFDWDIARSLIEPLVREHGPAARMFAGRAELHVAAAAIDPKWGVALVEAMPDDPDLKVRSPKNAARLAVANLLGRAADQQFRHLQYSFLNLWVPDTEDIDRDD